MTPWQRSFTVEGLNLERFLLKAGEQNIRLTAVTRREKRRLKAQAQECDIPRLQELAQRGGWQFTLGPRRGLGVLASWLHARWLLAAAIGMGLLAAFLATQTMWRVEIVGGGTYQADVAAALEEMGVRPPMRKAAVNIGSLRDALEWRYPRVAWFECGWRGMTLVVRPVEGVLPMEETPPDGPCDIVAGRDGIVYSLVTRAGTPAVSVGDLVRKGDVLIRGEERTGDGQTRPVAARGTVLARVWEGASVRMPLTETKTAYTGSEQQAWTIRCPFFDLWRMPDCEYGRHDTAVQEMPLGGFFLPLVYRRETRMEAECTPSRRDMAEVRREGEEAARRKLREKVGTGESIVDIWGNCSMIEDEILLSVAIGEMRVDIGMQQRPDGMTAP